MLGFFGMPAIVFLSDNMHAYKFDMFSSLVKSWHRLLTCFPAVSKSMKNIICFVFEDILLMDANISYAWDSPRAFWKGTSSDFNFCDNLLNNNGLVFINMAW